MRDIGIFNWFGYPMDMEERARLIKDAGFKHTMLWWGDEYAEYAGPKEKHPDIFRGLGLEIASVHLPFRGVNHLWEDNAKGVAIFDYLAACLESAAQHALPVAVLHITGGSAPPPFSSIGVTRLQKLADLAAKGGLVLALENLQRLDYLDYIFAGVTSEALGFCYDSGHDLLFAARPYLLLDQYGHKLKAVHLHDNRGVFDEHLIPGNGHIEWPLVKHKLDKYYDGPYMLECQNYGKGLKQIKPEHYLQNAFAAAQKLLNNKKDPL